MSENTQTMSKIVSDVFHNYVLFSPDERSFQIKVDQSWEKPYYLDLIDKDEGISNTSADSEIDTNLEEIDLSAVFSKDDSLFKHFSEKFHIDRKQFEDDIRYLYADYPQAEKTPLINVLSGTEITLSYGEGLLDFMYADFKTPVQKEISFQKAMRFLAKEYASKRAHEETSSAPQPIQIHQSNLSDEEKNLLDQYYEYSFSFIQIDRIAYASLYSAICPPVIREEANTVEALEIYSRYLQALQNEFRQQMEFCYDETFYPDVLGNLSPSERYGLYREYKGYPSTALRKETAQFAITDPTGDDMPYGMSPRDFLDRINQDIKVTDQHIEFASKMGIPVEELLMRIKLPHFICIRYEFQNINQILELEFTKMLEQNVRFRRCKRCGRYFIMKGNYDTNYCDRVSPGETKNCQELAALENYRAKIADNKAIPAYNKYYKRYAARVKARQIKEADFKKWKYQAITKRDECSDGLITLEDYIQWMEDSFPNRKPKNKS